MALEILLNTALSLPLSAALQTQPTESPGSQAFKNIFYHPAENIGAILALALALIALIGLIFYVVKKKCCEVPQPAERV